MDLHVLLVEDEDRLRTTLALLLEEAGCRVVAAPDGETALPLLSQHEFDVLLSDIKMRDVSGVDLLNAARKLAAPPEVILLTGYGSMETAIEALRAGAFDYLVKPCRPPQVLDCVERAGDKRRQDASQRAFIQMVARGVSDLQRRPAAHETPAPAPEPLPIEPPPAARRYSSIGRLSLDHYTHNLDIDGNVITLTPIEYALLSYLSEAQGRVISYPELVRHTHGITVDTDEAQQLVKAHILRLRKKIGNSFLINVRGVGYRLASPEDEES